MSLKIGCLTDRAARIGAKNICKNAFTDWELVPEEELFLFRHLEDGTLDYLILDAWKMKHKLPKYLEVAKVLPRESARNVMLFHGLKMLDDLLYKSHIGVMNEAQAVQVRHWRGDLMPEVYEHPTDECLAEFAKGDYEGFIVPKVDLDRLAMTGIMKYEILIPPTFLGLPGQGITIVVKKPGHEPDESLQRIFNDRNTEKEYRAEMAFRNRFVDNETPYAVFCYHEGDRLQCMAQLTDETGKKHVNRILSGDNPEELGKTVYKKLMEMLEMHG